MATISFTDGSGELKTVPTWATEAQMEKLLTALGANGDQKKVAEVSEKLVNEIKDLNQAVKDLGEEIEDMPDEINDTFDTMNDELESVGLSFRSIIGGLGDAVGGFVDFLVGSAIAILGTAITAVTAKVVQLGNSFNELSQSGLALEGSTALNIARMNELGLSTSDATKTMLENSLVFRSMGSTVVPEVIETFLNLTDQGGDLGLALGDSIDLIMQEFSMRANLVNLGRLDATQRGQAIKRIAEVNRNQLDYSRALGVSTDAMRDFADQVIGNNQMLLSNIIRLPNDVRMELATGLTDFISGMRAMGGEAGGEIGAAVLEAASMGAIGFSDAAFEFVKVLPSLSDNMQDVIEQFNSGVISGREAAMSFTNELGNLSEAEKNRVFLLARAGDEQAKAMASAIQQFEISAENMKKQGTTIENVQKGFNAFNAVVDKVKGMFSAAFNNFMDGFGAGAGEMADFAQGIANAFQPLMASLFGLDSGMGSTSEGMKNLGFNVAKGLTDKIKAFALFLAESIEYARGYFKQLEGDSIGAKIGSLMKDIGEAFLTGITDLIPWGKVALIVGGLVGVAAVKGLVSGMAQGAGAQMVGGAAAGGAGAGAGKGMGGMMKGMGRGMKALAVGVRAFASPMVIAGLAVITAAIIGIGFALKLAAPGIEAFGKAIKSVFEGIAAVVKAVGDSIANIIEKVGQNKVAKINAKAEAMVKTTKATTEAIKELSHLDPANVKGLAEGIDLLGNSLGTFSDNMSPSMLDTLRGGFAALFGQQSPIQAVMELTTNADPIKMMDTAKATMAINAANAGATSLDPSLTQSTSVVQGGTSNITQIENTNDNSGMMELLNTLIAQTGEHSEMMKKTNRLLGEINTKT